MKTLKVWTPRRLAARIYQEGAAVAVALQVPCRCGPCPGTARSGRRLGYLMHACILVVRSCADPQVDLIILGDGHLSVSALLTP